MQCRNRHSPAFVDYTSRPCSPSGRSMSNCSFRRRSRGWCCYIRCAARPVRVRISQDVAPVGTIVHGRLRTLLSISPHLKLSSNCSGLHSTLFETRNDEQTFRSHKQTRVLLRSCWSPGHKCRSDTQRARSLLSRCCARTGVRRPSSSSSAVSCRRIDGRSFQHHRRRLSAMQLV